MLVNLGDFLGALARRPDEESLLDWRLDLYELADLMAPRSYKSLVTSRERSCKTTSCKLATTLHLCRLGNYSGIS